jgi:hypothetical protein
VEDNDDIVSIIYAPPRSNTEDTTRAAGRDIHTGRLQCLLLAPLFTENKAQKRGSSSPSSISNHFLFDRGIKDALSGFFLVLIASGETLAQRNSAILGGGCVGCGAL